MLVLALALVLVLVLVLVPPPKLDLVRAAGWQVGSSRLPERVGCFIVFRCRHSYIQDNSSLAMSWQNFFFHLETLRISDVQSWRAFCALVLNSTTGAGSRVGGGSLLAPHTLVKTKDDARACDGLYVRTYAEK